MDLSCRIKRKIGEISSMKILSAKSSPVISICNNTRFIREREREKENLKLSTEDSSGISKSRKILERAKFQDEILVRDLYGIHEILCLRCTKLERVKSFETELSMIFMSLSSLLSQIHTRTFILTLSLFLSLFIILDTLFRY